MPLPLRYNWRNLFGRRISTAMTVAGIALVVAVYLLVLSLSEGLRRTFESPVSARSVVALRVGAQSDAMSVLSIADADAIRTLSGLELDAAGRPLVSPEIVVLVRVPKFDGKKTNIVLRGVQDEAFALQPGLKMAAGRRFRPGTNEAIISASAQKRFAGMQLGATVRSASQSWLITGVFEASNSPYDSEIWADLGNVQEQAHRQGFLSVVRLRANDLAARDRLISEIGSDQRLKLAAKTEQKYFEEQSGAARPIEFLAHLVGAVMAVGAVFGAMNTMYAQVTARTREIATMRALGFSRPAVLAAFVAESAALSLAGGVLGVLAAAVAVRSLWAGPTGTQNFATFAEVVFHFSLSPLLAAQGLLFSLAIGVAGGFFPALAAARMPIVGALRRA